MDELQRGRRPVGADRRGGAPAANRGRWAKTIGNDKRPRIRLPEGWLTAVVRGEQNPTTGGRPAVVRSPESALVDALRAHNETLKADVEALKAQLAAQAAADDERAEKQAADFAGRDAERLADLARERERADKAIAAFEQLARRLEEMAEARRPWWRRLASPAWGKGGT